MFWLAVAVNGSARMTVRCTHFVHHTQSFGIFFSLLFFVFALLCLALSLLAFKKRIFVPTTIRGGEMAYPSHCNNIFQSISGARDFYAIVCVRVKELGTAMTVLV